MITREAFVSWPDRVLVVRISADKPGRINFAAQFRGPYLETSVADRNRLVMDGTWKGPFPGPATGMAGLIAHTTGKGLRYEAALAARLEGGASEATGSTLNIHNANAVTLVMAMATSFVNYHDISGDPAARCKKVLNAAAGKDFATLLRRHMDDFRGLMGRVHLQIGDASQNDKPTDERLKAVRAGGIGCESGGARASNSAVTFWRPAAASAASRPISRASGTRPFFRRGAANTPSTSTWK